MAHITGTTACTIKTIESNTFFSNSESTKTWQDKVYTATYKLFPDPDRPDVHGWTASCILSDMKDWIDYYKGGYSGTSNIRILQAYVTQYWANKDLPTFYEQFLGFKRMWSFPNDRSHGRENTYVITGVFRDLTERNGAEFFEEVVPKMMEQIKNEMITVKRET